MLRVICQSTPPGTKGTQATLCSQKDHKLCRVPLGVSYSRKARAYAINNNFVLGDMAYSVLWDLPAESPSRGERARVRQVERYAINTQRQCPSFDGDTNDSALVSDKPIQRRRKIGEIEQNGYTAVGL